jgi:hypothetical protein
MTDRVLPQLFPNVSTGVFADTVDHAVSIESPPPSTTQITATNLSALGALGTQNFFPSAARSRVAIVFTDGESRAFDAQQVRRQLAAGPGVHLVLVHVGRPGETVYVGGRPEAGYHEDPASAQVLAGLAAATHGKALGEGSPGAVVAAARAALGSGPVAREGTAARTVTLAPYVALAALLPLLFLVGLGVGVALRRAADSRTKGTDQATTGRPVPLHVER